MKDDRINKKRPMRFRNKEGRDKYHEGMKASLGGKRDVIIDARMGEKSR